MDNLLKWIRVLHNESEIIEIRSIDPKPTLSGYFRADSPNIAQELARYPDRTFYQNLNPVEPDCYSRSQHEKLVAYPRQTTSDDDILGYQWILVDADPVRRSGISATNTEKEAARLVSRRVWKCLKQRGFCDPVIADSGNGYHLLYKVQAQLSEKVTVEHFLATLDMWFSNEAVQIDTSVYNPARITKLYGTMARKGADTEERPHRQSRLLNIPSEICITPWDLVKRVADEYTSTLDGTLAAQENVGSNFDLEQFLTTHGVEVVKKIQSAGVTKYVLKECPFDSSHKAPDAAVFQSASGALGFKCFHNSCSDYSWHDFRHKLDPSAYSATSAPTSSYTSFPQPVEDDDEAEETVREVVTKHTQIAAAPIQQPPMMINIADIEEYDRSKIVIVKSRLQKLDTLIGGFNLGEMTVWSGGNGSGKSTLVGQIGLAAVHQGFKVAMFSGELRRSRVKEWLYLQAAGRENVIPNPLHPKHFMLRPGVKEHLDETLGGKLALYNNDYGNSWEAVTTAMFNWVYEQKANIIIVDNLMALQFTGMPTDKNEMQSMAAKTLSQAAKQLNAHVHFIAHPRKTDGFLRKIDISGTADLTNVADNVIMVHRNTTDFACHLKEVYPRLQIPGGAGNALEIMKNRDLGVMDEMVFLYFDKSTKTMSDVKGGVPQYGWADSLIPVDAKDIPDFPF